MEQLIGHDPNWPDVIFQGIDVLFEGLGGHVERASNIVSFLLRTIFEFLCETEIRNFSFPIMNQDVG